VINLKLAVVGSVLALAVGYLVLTGMQGTAVYYLTVSELQSGGPGLVGRPVRLAGLVAPGSIEKLNGGLALHFIVQDDSGSFPVTYRGGPVPDIFGEQVEVVVEGRVQQDGVFAADTLLAKCPSKFEDGQTASS
jgi:cytochrome c-type biogenesis protein CcmE